MWPSGLQSGPWRSGLRALACSPPRSAYALIGRPSAPGHPWPSLPAGHPCPRPQSLAGRPCPVRNPFTPPRMPGCFLSASSRCSVRWSSVVSVASLPPGSKLPFPFCFSFTLALPVLPLLGRVALVFFLLIEDPSSTRQAAVVFFPPSPALVSFRLPIAPAGCVVFGSSPETELTASLVSLFSPSSSSAFTPAFLSRFVPGLGADGRGGSSSPTVPGALSSREPSSAAPSVMLAAVNRGDGLGRVSLARSWRRRIPVATLIRAARLAVAIAEAPDAVSDNQSR